jgi:hypothetical protein
MIGIDHLVGFDLSARFTVRLERLTARLASRPLFPDSGCEGSSAASSSMSPSLGW